MDSPTDEAEPMIRPRHTRRLVTAIVDTAKKQSQLTRTIEEALQHMSEHNHNEELLAALRENTAALRENNELRKKGEQPPSSTPSEPATPEAKPEPPSKKKHAKHKHTREGELHDRTLHDDSLEDNTLHSPVAEQQEENQVVS